MIDGRNPQPAPDAPVPLDLAAITTALASIESTTTDAATRMSLVRALEVLGCAVSGAQAALSVEFEASQVATQVAADEPVSRQGLGVASQIGFARRESLRRARFHLDLARMVTADMPHLSAGWRHGRFSEYRVQLIARHAWALSRPDRLLLDERLVGTPFRVLDLERRGDKAAEDLAGQYAYEIDRHAVIARTRTARTDRHTKLRGAADGMAWFSALVPLKDGIAIQASLSAAATGARNTTGDDRTRGQVMADTLVDRVTGRTDDTPVPVHVEVVVPVDVATGQGPNADARCWSPAYGPVPAHVAREWAEHAETYTRIWADAPTGQVVGTESVSQARCYPPGLATHARRRDQTCRIPWCDAPIKHTDHSVDAATGGHTSIQNAGGLCEAHNHEKQAHGWTATTHRDPDGTHVITYTTPTGQSYESRPPPAYPPRE